MTLLSFGHSECSRVKELEMFFLVFLQRYISGISVCFHDGRRLCEMGSTL